MRKFFYLILAFCLALSVCVNKVDITSVFADNSASIVMEVSSLRVLDGVNYHQKKYMASTTKILTAICVIENCDINSIVKIPKEAVGIEGSSIYLEAGEELSVKDLLYGLMLRSGNDASVALALHCSGSIDKFALLMNNLAKKIGAFNSNFVNPHGLHDDNHYTTAYDLALISCYAIKNPTFKEIVSTKKVTIPHTSKNCGRVLINKNKMLFNYDGCNGIKTGYTKKAGRCLVSSALVDGLEVVSVVLNTPDMWDKSKQLLDNVFSKYKSYNIVESDNFIAFADIYGVPDEKCGLYIKNDVVLPLTEEEYSSIKVVYDYPCNLKIPFNKDQEVGQIKIYIKNNLIFCEKIYTIISKS